METPDNNRLWTMDDAAAFLQKSRRWLTAALKVPAERPGSVPHQRLGRSPRFVPDELMTWAKMGFPPVTTFREWRADEEKKKRRAS